MKRRRLALAILASAALASSAARAGDLASARAFVAWIYSHYPTATHRPVFDALGVANKRVIFAPSLIALFDEDTRLAHGEVGALDGDPLCDCQDDGGMVFKIASVRPVDPAHASAVVVRSYPDSKVPEIEAITLDLTLAKGRWRVFDVRSKDTPSLRAMLIQSNRAAH
jgi:Protein of unknown function (DUF3828)